MTVDAERVGSEILRDMLKFQCQEAALRAFETEGRLRQIYGRAVPSKPVKGQLTQRTPVITMRRHDIYGQETTSDVRYFVCSRCDRSVAGHRFAAHVTRCAGGGRR